VRTIETRVKEQNKYEKFILDFYRDQGNGSGSDWRIVDDDEKIENQRDQLDWGKGIIIKRLINNKLELLDNINRRMNSEEPEIDFDPENSVFNQNYDSYFEYKFESQDETFFNKHDAKQLIIQNLQRQKENKNIKSFKIFTYLWIVFFLGLYTYSYYLSINSLGTLLDSKYNLKKSHNK
jgi:hypothetical protein